MKKRFLIEIKQENLIECDNKSCDYVIPNITGDPFVRGEEYINKACPKCGENLLTQKDFDDYSKFLKIVSWLNKYFSWLTFFSCKEEKKMVKIHNNKIIIKNDDKR